MITDFFKIKILSFLTILAMAIGFLGHAPQAHALTTEQKLSDIEQFFSNTKAFYAPLEIKQKSGLNLDQLQKQYESLSLQTQSDLQFSYLIVQLAAEMKDTHFAASVPTRSRAFLGVQTDLYENKVLVTKTTSDLAGFIKVGDEILAVNSKPVFEELLSLKKNVSRSTDSSRLRRAATYLFDRPGTIFPLPSGEVLVTIKSAETGEEQEYEFNWQQQDLSWEENLKNKFREKSGESFSYCSHTSRLPVPKNAVQIGDSVLTAYYTPTPRGNIGYLRMGNFKPYIEFPNDRQANLKRFAQLELILSQMEQQTEGLILDLDQNCGGSIPLAQMLSTLFIGEPFSPPQFQLLAGRWSIAYFENILNDPTPSITDKQNTLKIIDLLKNSIEANLRLTPKTSINGADILLPNKIRYTKPLIVLVDNLTVSAAEIFTSLLRDNKRALILGSTTGGAGGDVESHGPLNYSQVSIAMTDSVFYRNDGSTIDGVGLTPDIPYSITVTDFRSNLKPYSKFIYKQMSSIIKHSKQATLPVLR